MSIIRPISDLRNHADQISDICHRQAEPVFITKNGKGDLVVMSEALFNQQQALLTLYRKLEEAELSLIKHPEGISFKKVMKGLRQKIR
jgi:prevent-host-death family protein